MKKNVPLVVYEKGNRIEIGTADIEVGEQGGITATGEITDPKYMDLIRGKDSDLYSIDFVRGDPKEATIVPQVGIPAGRAQFMGVIPSPPWKDSNDD